MTFAMTPSQGSKGDVASVEAGRSGSRSAAHHSERIRRKAIGHPGESRKAAPIRARPLRPADRTTPLDSGIISAPMTDHKPDQGAVRSGTLAPRVPHPPPRDASRELMRLTADRITAAIPGENRLARLRCVCPDSYGSRTRQAELSGRTSEARWRLAGQAPGRSLGRSSRNWDLSGSLSMF